MGDVLVKQNLYAVVAKNPASGTPISERDFAVDPAEQVDITDFNENASSRFQVAATSSLTLPMDSVALGSIFFLRVETACALVITNGLGSSQQLMLKPGRTSVLHADFTGLQLVNAGSTIVKGRYCVIGD